jgi:hypothetical protein
MNEENLRKLQKEKDRQITTLEKSLADNFQRMELLLERLVRQKNGLDATQIVTDSTREANESFLSDGMFAEEAKQERNQQETQQWTIRCCQTGHFLRKK